MPPRFSKSTWGAPSLLGTDAASDRSLDALAHARIVGLAVGPAFDRVDEHDVARRLVAGEQAARVFDERLRLDLRAGERLDHRGDDLAEPGVGQADDHGVADVGMRLERLLDLLREDLLSAGVDAGRAAAEK